MRQQNRPLVTKLVLASLAMFAFGFALVPLYDVFCELTGLNGKTGRIELTEAAKESIDTDRTISVELLSSLNRSLNWDFYPLDDKVDVHPGGMYTVNYYVKNKTARRVVARAVPSVVPVKASAYFDKVECFCFTEQVFEPNEARELPVRFIVKSNLPSDIKTISLAYTFFDITDSATQAAALHK